jgi:GNAT superfamily N-acetyltransferase
MPMHIRPFISSDQQQAKALVQAGLGEHWGWIDETLNPDLNDIEASYAGGVFLVGEVDEVIVATGAYLPVDDDTAQIVRMSVRKDMRRAGLGRFVLRALLEHARAARFRRAVLETTETWHEVTAFYLANGFSITQRANGEVWFARMLAPHATNDH